VATLDTRGRRLTAAVLIAAGGLLIALSAFLPWVRVDVIGNLNLFRLLKLAGEPENVGWVAIGLGVTVPIVTRSLFRHAATVRWFAIAVAGVVALTGSFGTMKLIDLVTTQYGHARIQSGVVLLGAAEVMFLVGVLLSGTAAAGASGQVHSVSAAHGSIPTAPTPGQLQKGRGAAEGSGPGIEWFTSAMSRTAGAATTRGTMPMTTVARIKAKAAAASRRQVVPAGAAILVAAAAFLAGRLSAPTQGGNGAPAPARVAFDYEAAVRRVRALGFAVVTDQSREVSLPGPLRAITALCAKGPDSASGHCAQAFFFVDDRYIGRATLHPAISVALGTQTANTTELVYPQCFELPGSSPCRAHPIRVRFFWNGLKLVTLDPLPPTYESG
jgi:hypothetical protein